MTYGALIVGLGQIGMGYDLALAPAKSVYTHARAFSVHSAFELVGAVDPAEKKRDLFKRHYAHPVYPTIASALLAQTASVVVISSPTAQHSVTLKEVLAHSSPKLILCEKPLAYDLDEAREMVEACESAGVKLFVNYMRRADPGVMEIKARIGSGKIAEPINGVVWYSKGFLHNGSHFFNLLEFWLGSFIRAKILNAGRLWHNQDPEPDVQVEFEQGKVVFLAAWEEAFSHYTIELLSPSGRLRYDQGGKSITWQSTHSNSSIAGQEILQTFPETVANGLIRYQWHVADQLANALADKPHTLSTGRQSLVTLEAMHQIINQQ
jgi:predicted dehydrogenase